jgi:cytochrome c oxidase subunit II
MEQKGTFWLPPQASTTAAEIDAIFYFVLWTSLIIFAGVVFFMVFYAWKYRRRSAADRPVDVEPNKWLELSWVVIPSLLVLVVFWWGMQAFITAGIPPANAYQINVTARMWAWDFEYPNGKRSTGDLVVPIGQPVQLVMTSQDVLHSLFVPAFRVKKDVLPNRYTSLWFEVIEPGEYQVLCTEYCGRAHSEMYARVIALEPREFAEWVRAVDDLDAVPLPEIGEQIFRQQGCQACHSIDGSPAVGPSFLGTWGQPRPQTDGSSPIMDADYVIESILRPNARITAGYPPVMPAFPNLSERQLQGIVAYIMQINGAWTDEAALGLEGEPDVDAEAVEADATQPVEAPVTE